MLPASPASFVGRERERRRVARLWHKSRIVLLLGAGGIGKSALMRKLVEDLAGSSAVFGHRCGAATSLLDGLEAALRLPPLSTTKDDRTLRLAESLDGRGGVLCIDDVHELPPGEVGALLAIAALLRKGRILATSRRKLELGELETSATVVELGPLSLAEAEALVEELLDRVGREADPVALARRASGSPLWCRLLAGGAERVEEHLGSLLDGLPADARSMLERLAAFREPVSSGWLEAPSHALFRELEARFLVERVGATGAPAEPTLFVHDLVREVTLASLPEERRRALHLGCADVYARMNPEDWGSRLHHLEQAGDQRRLERALHDGGAAWLWAHRRLGDCVRLVDAALAGSEAPSPRLRLREALCLAVQGERAAARRAFEAAGPVPAADAFLHDLTELALLQEEGERAAVRQARYQTLLAKAGPDVEPADFGQVANAFVRDCLVQGNLEAAFSVHADLERGAARIDELSRARIARRLGDFLSEQGDGAGAARALESAEQSAARLQSPQLLAATHNCWVEHHVRYGDLRAAEAHLARADAVPVPAGQTDTYAIRELRRAQVFLARGWLGRAAETLASCLARGALAPVTRGSLLAETAAIAAQRGDPGTARAAARRVLEIPRAQRPSVSLLTALSALARAEIDAGRFARARRIAAAMTELAWRGTLRERAVVGLLLQAEATAGVRGPMTTPRLDEAREILATALSLARGMRARPLVAATLLVRALVHPRGAPARRGDAEQALALAHETGSHLLASRAELMLGFCDLVDGEDEAATRHHAAARSAAKQFGSPPIDAEVEQLGLAIRARAGSRKARSDLAARPEAREVLELVSRPPRHVVTRAGRRQASAREASPEAHELWMDASSGAVVVGGSHRLDLAQRPLLRRLLEVLLAAPGDHFPKERLFADVWQLPYRAARDATLHKAVDRLATLLYPDEPHRLARWDERGRLVLGVGTPCLVLREDEAALNDRQRWVLSELERRPTVSNRDLRAALGVPRATAQRDLDHLVTLGLVRREGQGRSTTYRR